MRGILTLAILFLLTIVTFANASMRGSGTIPYTIDTTNNNISIGPNSMAAVTTGTQNICIGNATCTGLTVGLQNLVLNNGESALITGNYNILMGYGADVVNSATQDAIGIGVGVTVGEGSIAIGYWALHGTTSALSNNVGIGWQALQGVTTGTYNTALGSYAGNATTGGVSNLTLIGDNAGYNITTGSKNTLVGYQAGNFISTGASNVMLGFRAGSNSSSAGAGGSNVVIGPLVGSTLLAAGSNNILIGTTSAIDATTSTASNEIHIGGSGGDWVKVTGANVNTTEVTTMNGSLNVTGTLSQNGTLVSAAGSLAEMQIDYQPGLLTAVNSTIGVMAKFAKTSTVDNIIGSAITFTCAVNPTVTLYECGTTITCDSSPTTIGTVTLTAGGTAMVGTINSATITAGHYIGWAMTAGTCASVDLAVTAQLHAN